MNDQVFGVHCSNGFREFDSHTTTIKCKIMYEVLEHWKQYQKEKRKQKALKEMDKFLAKLVKKNGKTNY